jgi:transposase InsO family protein
MALPIVKPLPGTAARCSLPPPSALESQPARSPPPPLLLRARLHCRPFSSPPRCWPPSMRSTPRPHPDAMNGRFVPTPSPPSPSHLAVSLLKAGGVVDCHEHQRPQTTNNTFPSAQDQHLQSPSTVRV